MPACIAKVTVYKRLQEPRKADKWQISRDSKIVLGIRRAQYKVTDRAVTTAFQEARHKA